MKHAIIPRNPFHRLCVFILIAVLIAPGALLAKSTTWTHGSLVNDLWSNPDNWNNGVPVNFDNVYFSSIGGMSTMDVPVLRLNTMNMTGYVGSLVATGAALQVTGTMTMSGTCHFDNSDLTIAGNLVINDTTYAGHTTISVSGSLNIAGGDLDCRPGGTTIDVGGSVTGSAGATLEMGSGALNLYYNGFFANFAAVSWSEGGTLNCRGSGTQQIAFGSSTVTLHDVTLSRGAVSDLTELASTNPLVIGGSLTVLKGILQPAANEVEFAGTATVRGEFRYSVPGGTLRFAAGSAGKVDAGGGGIFTISGTPSARIWLRQDGLPGGSQWILAYDATSKIIIDAARVQDSDAQGPAPAPATHSADKGNNTNWNFIGPKTTVWTAESLESTNWSDPLNWDLGSPQTGDDVEFDAIGGTSTMDMSGLSLASLDMTGYSGELTALHSLAMTGNMLACGTLDFDGQSLSVGGDLTVAGVMGAAGATIGILGDLIVDGELNCDPEGVIEVQGDITGSAGAILEMGSGDLTLDGNGSLGDFAEVSWSEGGSLNCGGSGTQQIAFGSSTVTVHDVTLQRGAVSDVTQIDRSSALVIGGNITVLKGILQPTASDVQFSGTLTVRGEFDYSTFGGMLRFATGSSGTVDVGGGGTLRINGTTPSRIRLRQDGIPGGEQWILAHDGTSTITVDAAEVQDSDAQGPAPVLATHSADKGNNTNWNFSGPKTTKWTAESLTSTDWSDPLNWDLGSPQSGDSVVFDTVGGASTMDIPGLTLASLDMSGYSGELTMMCSLDVAGDMKTSGGVTIEGNSLAIAGSLAVWGTMNAAGATIAIGADLDLHGTCNWTPDAAVNVTGTVEAFSGTILNMGSSLLRIGGDLLLSAPSALYLCDIGHLVCAGDSPVQVVSFPSVANIVMLDDVTVQRAEGSQVTQFKRPGPSIALQGTLDVAIGVFELAQGNLWVDGATNIQATGRLEVGPGGGVATFNGPLSVRGALSYKRPEGRIRFATGSAGAVDATNGGVFEVIGTPAGRVRLEQEGTPGGDRWILLHDETTTINVDYVDLQDGDAQGTGLAAAMNSLDMGNNVNWYFGTVSGDDAPPLRLSLAAAPNPFNPSTTLHFSLPRAGAVSIRIYDATGSLVRSLVSGHHAAGNYQASWNGRNDAGRAVGSGAYFCRLESSDGAVVRKLLLFR